MLRAKGHDVQIANAGERRHLGRNARSAGGVRAARHAVRDPRSRQQLHQGVHGALASTEMRHEAERAANIAAIVSRLEARGIKVFMANIEFRAIPISDWQRRIAAI